MTNQELQDYIITEIRHGIPEVEIRKALFAAGWQAQDIDVDIAAAHQKLGLVPSGFINESKEKRDFLHKHTKAMVALALATLLLAGGAFAAMKLMPPSPEKVLQQAYANMDKVNSLDFSGSITADVNAPSDILNLEAYLPGAKELAKIIPDPRIAGASNVQLGIDFRGSLDGTDEKHPKAQIRLDILSGIFSMGFETRVVNEAVYFKLDQIPPLSEQITKYENTWIKVDTSTIPDQYGVDKIPGQADLTDNQKKQIADLTTNAHFFNSITKLADDSIDSVGMYHYAVVIDKAGLKYYLDQVQKIQTAAGGLNSVTSEVLDNLQFKDTEFWVGKSDRTIHRISGQVTEAASNDAIPVSGSLHFLLNLTNFNAVSKIEAPSNSKNFEDIMKEFTAPALTTPVKP